MLDRFDAAVQFYKANPSAPASEAPAPPVTINKRGGQTGKQRDPVQDQHNPTVLFNGMIKPGDSVRRFAACFGTKGNPSWAASWAWRCIPT